MTDVRLAVSMYEDAAIGEFNLGAILIASINKDSTTSSDRLSLSLLISYFSAARCCRLERSTGLHSVGFTEQERSDINSAWTHFGGTIDLFDLASLEEGHDWHDFKVFSKSALSKLQKVTEENNVHISYITAALCVQINKGFKELGIATTFVEKE